MRLLGNLSLSADFYRVAIKDLVVLSGLFSADDEVSGEPRGDPRTVPRRGPSFFVNAVDTTTNGLHVVFDYSSSRPRPRRTSRRPPSMPSAFRTACASSSTPPGVVPSKSAGCSWVTTARTGSRIWGRAERVRCRSSRTTDAGRARNSDDGSLDESFGEEVTVDVDVPGRAVVEHRRDERGHQGQGETRQPFNGSFLYGIDGAVYYVRAEYRR